MSEIDTTESTSEPLFTSRIDLVPFSQTVEKISTEIKKVIIGQDEIIDLLMISILANGHVLLEGVPGVAKTMLAKSLAKALQIGFSRIQFTPDLMPSDVLGTSIFNPTTAKFDFKEGPIFSQLILIDEINRAPAKTQSALFEVMEERQITIDGKRHIMKAPFIVIATQNPVEQEGTYRLPEAQLDRFLFKLEMGYPEVVHEVDMLESFHERKGADPLDSLNSIITGEEIAEAQQIINSIHLDKNLMEYIVQIVNSTRVNKDIFLGASPRASLNIM
ncbi:MAG: AAA family ATPase, partial [Bacteroidota bacterium]